MYEGVKQVQAANPDAEDASEEQQIDTNSAAVQVGKKRDRDPK